MHVNVFMWYLIITQRKTSVTTRDWVNFICWWCSFMQQVFSQMLVFKQSPVADSASKCNRENQQNETGLKSGSGYTDSPDELFTWGRFLPPHHWVCFTIFSVMCTKLTQIFMWKFKMWIKTWIEMNLFPVEEHKYQKQEYWLNRMTYNYCFIEMKMI